MGAINILYEVTTVGMNKNKPHFQVTYEVNLNSTAHKTIDVWAATEKMAIKKAEEIIKRDKGVFHHCNPSVRRC